MISQFWHKMRRTGESGSEIRNMRLWAFNTRVRTVIDDATLDRY